jgi:hypothetical protein
MIYLLVETPYGAVSAIRSIQAGKMPIYVAATDLKKRRGYNVRAAIDVVDIINAGQKHLYDSDISIIKNFENIKRVLGMRNSFREYPAGLNIRKYWSSTPRHLSRQAF